MNYYVSEEITTAWDSIISAFITMVEYNVEFNNGVPIDDLAFNVKRGLLDVTYSGGDKVTDSFAMFAREMSSNICSDCGVPATRRVFGSPKCNDCY